MDNWFPNFRRWMTTQFHVPFPSLWRRRATWAQQKSLLRLIVAATEENLPLSPLVAAWAKDEPYSQRRRLDRLADLLRAGTPLPDAVEEVRGVLGDEDMLAVRFGAQSGTLAAAMRERLNEPGPMASNISPRMRQTMFYLTAMLVLGSIIVAFFEIKIMPAFNKIAQDFDMPVPKTLEWSVRFSDFVANYWYVYLLAVIALCWLAFSSWPGRRLRRAILTRVIRPLRVLHTADVLEKLGVAIDAGRPVSGALSTLARYHFDPTLRHQLLYIRNEVEQGVDVWRSMAAIGLLSPARRPACWRRPTASAIAPGRCGKSPRSRGGERCGGWPNCRIWRCPPSCCCLAATCCFRPWACSASWPRSCIHSCER